MIEKLTSHYFYEVSDTDIEKEAAIEPTWHPISSYANGILLPPGFPIKFKVEGHITKGNQKIQPKFIVFRVKYSFQQDQELRIILSLDEAETLDSGASHEHLLKFVKDCSFH